WVGQLVFWPDGRTLASCSADQTIRLWDVTDPAHVKPIGRPLRGHEHEVWRMALLPGQTILVTGDRDGHVCLWDLDAVKQKPSDHVMFPSEGWVFEQAGAAILSMATDGRILRRQGNDLLSESEYMTVGRRLRAKCSARPLGNRYMLAHAEDRMCALDLPARRTI